VTYSAGWHSLFSIGNSPAATNRPDIADTSKATADEVRALWGPLVANAGTYQISGDLITIHPLVAKIPVVMKPGANEGLSVPD
jgi:hypothetical protein